MFDNIKVHFFMNVEDGGNYFKMKDDYSIACKSFSALGQDRHDKVCILLHKN